MKLPDNVELIENLAPVRIPGHEGAICITGPWSDEIRNFIINNQIEKLFLIRHIGWIGYDYSFLSELHSIRFLRILTGETKNLSALTEMSNLEKLGLECATREDVNLLQIKNLKDCYLYWWPGASSIFSCKKLKKLYLDSPKQQNLDELCNLTDLESLTISNSPLNSIEFLKKLSNLKRLSLQDCRRISDYSPISTLSKIEWIDIRGSRHITDLNFVIGLDNLQNLIIESNSTIDNLKPIAALRNIRGFRLYGNKMNIADGDLGCLENHPTLANLSFRNKRHYTHKVIAKWDWKKVDKPRKLLEKKN